MLPSQSIVTRLPGSGRSSVVSQKSTPCLATSSRLHRGASLVSLGSSPFMAIALDLPSSWMLPSGRAAVGGEVEVVEPQGLLEHRLVGLLAQRRSRPCCCGTCSCARPGRSRWPGHRGGGRWPTASRILALFAAPAQTSDHDVGPVDLPLAAPGHDHPGDRPAGRVGLQPHHLGAGQQGHVRLAQQRPDRDDLGVGLGVHQARVAVHQAQRMQSLAAPVASSSRIPHGAWNGW